MGPRAIAACTFLLLCGGAPSEAQDRGAGGDPDGIRVGGVVFTPTLTLRDFGIDTNVFNEAQNPKRDWTVGVTPDVRASFRVGRAQITGHTGAAFVYFNEYASQRSINWNNEVRVDVLTHRVQPYVSAASGSTRERMNLEIDLRALRTTHAATTGVRVGASSKTSIDLSSSWSRMAFGSDATFAGVLLPRELNRNATGLTASLRYLLTPLTSIVLDANRQLERFEFATERNTDSFRGRYGMEFKPRALLSGHAYIGYKVFKPADPRVPAFTGPVATVAIDYVLLGATKFTATVGRDVNFSYNPQQPYYVATDYGGSISQRVSHAWELGGTIGRERLAYRRRATTAADDGPRTGSPVTRGLSAGGDVRYRLGDGTRIGLTVMHSRRVEPTTDRNFDGWRVGTSFSTGF